LHSDVGGRCKNEYKQREVATILERETLNHQGPQPQQQLVSGLCADELCTLGRAQ